MGHRQAVRGGEGQGRGHGSMAWGRDCRYGKGMVG